jgi:hypothetical protein
MRTLLAAGGKAGLASETSVGGQSSEVNASTFTLPEL